MKLWCATTNPGKVREFQAAAAALTGVHVEMLPEMRSVPPSPEDGLTFQENAAQKAVYYSRLAPGWLFADDSGLEVDALAGKPGVFSARYAGEHATGGENNALLLEQLSGAAHRHARFVCAIALARNGQLIETFRGIVDGAILPAPRGEGGFGYDPLFFYPPLGQTLAEITVERKFAISHRGHAFRALLDWIKRQPRE